jgi:hypothetical protein
VAEFDREHPLQRDVAFAEEHIMTTPEVLARRRRQILDDKAKHEAAAEESLEQEDRWVANFIANLNRLYPEVQVTAPWLSITVIIMSLAAIGYMVSLFM